MAGLQGEEGERRGQLRVCAGGVSEVIAFMLFQG